MTRRRRIKIAVLDKDSNWFVVYGLALIARGNKIKLRDNMFRRAGYNFPLGFWSLKLGIFSYRYP